MIEKKTDTQFRFSNYFYHESLSPFGSIGKSWGKYWDYFKISNMEYETDNELKYTTL